MPSQTITLSSDTNDGYGAGSWDSSAPNYLAANEDTGWSFAVTTQIPAGATISKAYLRINTNTTYSGSLISTLQVENADPATNTIWSGSHVAQGATCYTGATSASWNCTDYQNAWMFGESDSLPLNLSADVQSLVDNFGAIEVGHIINVRHSSTGSGPFIEIESAGETNSPALYIEWTAASGVSLEGGATAGAAASATITVQRNIASAAVAGALASGALSVQKALTGAAIGKALGSATLQMFAQVWRIPTSAPNGTAVHAVIMSGVAPTYAILAQGNATVAGGYIDLPGSGSAGAKAFAFVHNYNDNTATTSIRGGPSIATLTSI